MYDVSSTDYRFLNIGIYKVVFPSLFVPVIGEIIVNVFTIMFIHI